MLNMQQQERSYVPFLKCRRNDNNGNVTKYINEGGNVVAAYEYDDFGRIISQSGPMADVFRHRFSTKYFDSEIGLYYYGYRFYSPQLMRWLNRDPIGEDGGLNLYGFCGNNAACKYDLLGMETSTDGWELIGETSEAHSWNCIEWKNKDGRVRRKWNYSELGEESKDGGTQKNYIKHFREITFKLDIHVPDRCIDPFSYGIVSILEMSNDPKSYWCLTYAPLRVYKKCIKRKMKYLLKITVINLDKHPKYNNAPEIHQRDKEGRTFEYGPI